MTPNPEILTADATSAVTNAATEFAIIASPGVGMRIRLFSFDATINQTAAAGVSIRGSILSDVLNRVVGRTQVVAGAYPVDHIYLAGDAGVPLDENEGLAINAICTVAGPTNLFTTARYVVEVL